MFGYSFFGNLSYGLPIAVTFCVNEDFFKVPELFKTMVLDTIAMHCEQDELGEMSPVIPVTTSLLADCLINVACDCGGDVPCYTQEWADKFNKFLEDHLDQPMLLLMGNARNCDRKYFTKLWEYTEAGYGVADAKYLVKELC